jgi:hypothetical protein
MEILSKYYVEEEIIFSLKENNNNSLYINATKTAKSFNKKPVDWLKTQDTKNYINAVAKWQNLTYEELVIIYKGGNDKKAQGTWIHKKLIIAFARWLSSDFAVWCDLQIEEILKSQTSQNFDLDSYISENEKLIKLIELITSKNPMTLFYLDKLTKKLNLKSPIELLQIDLNSYYFIPTELGKFLNKTAMEVNKTLEKKGFQIKVNGVWQLTEAGQKYAIQLDNNFQTIKWRLESLI